MQISTSLFYDRATSQLTALSAKADKLQTQIATTKRIATPSDDVVAYQRLATIKQANANDAAYTTNIGLAQSLLKQTDTTLNDVTTQLQQAQELAVQAANGTLSDDNRVAISTQLKSIRDELVSLGNSTDARGQPLFGAATGDSAVTVGDDGKVSFTGTGAPSPIPVGDGVDVQASETAARVFGGIKTAGGTTDIFAILDTLTAALDACGPAAATAAGNALDGLNAASDHVNVVRGSAGARSARLDLESTRLTAVAADREIDRSGLEDTDITAAITELQKTSTILSATQASFSKLSSLSLFDYLR